MKVERSVISGQSARQAAISSSVRSAAAGRAMRLSVSGWACWNGMSR
jgi:hypothetical protein